MSFRNFKTEAIIIKRFNVGEADKLLTLVTPKYGKLRCLAKGVRRLYSKKAPSLELFSQVSLFLVKGRNLDLVTETQLVSGFSRLRGDLTRVRLAYQFAELINLMVTENQAQEEVYALLVKALTWLDGTESVQNEALRRFQIRLLNLLGFGLPKADDLESLKHYIEEIIDRKLVTGDHLDTTRSLA